MYERNSASSGPGAAELLRLRAAFEAKHARAPAIRNLDAEFLADEVYSDFMELLFIATRKEKETLLEYTEKDPRGLERIMTLPDA